jgi:glycyl-tRNA synthetase
MTTALETIVNLAKRRGFIFPGSDIYGGLANSWDYGPLGVLLKNNIRDAWWKFFVQQRSDMVGLDAAILMNPKVWEASGHVANFNDPLVDCRNCKARHRADHLIAKIDPAVNVDKMTLEEMNAYLADKKVACPNCGEAALTPARRFNLLFETSLGIVEDHKQSVYLRGELAQSMFVDFKLIADTMRKQVPFGIAQVGKVFRNEITPGNFTFRTLEFDLMEFEYFIKEADWESGLEMWLQEMERFLTAIGIDASRLRRREHEKEELAHYSKRTVDIEFETSFGWKELAAVAYRTDFDLKNHSQASGQDLSLTDPATGEKFFPHVLEPTVGLTRLTLMAMLSAYHEEEVKDEKRVVMKFKPALAPFQVAVLPLSKKEELMKVAEPLAAELRKHWNCDYDVTQSIGKRYRRQDEIGTPYCITVDFDSLTDNAVTIRDRDSMEQQRVPLSEVVATLTKSLT